MERNEDAGAGDREGLAALHGVQPDPDPTGPEYQTGLRISEARLAYFGQLYPEECREGRVQQVRLLRRGCGGLWVSM